MTESEVRFYALLAAMAAGEAPSAGKKPSTPPASSANGSGDCDETRTRPVTSKAVLRLAESADLHHARLSSTNP